MATPKAAPLASVVRLSEVLKNNLRLEATNYSVEARSAVEALRAAGYQLRPLYGEGGLSHEAHNAFRFKRIWVKPSKGVAFLSSSEIISMRPRAENYISRRLTPNLDKLLIRPWDVLLSCSGTIGNVALAGTTLQGKALSQDAIRIRFAQPELAGYAAAFLRSPLGRAQVQQATYGSVVVHIEPHHLDRVLLPAPSKNLLETIGRPMCEATAARDRANDLLDEANHKLRSYLRFPSLLPEAEIEGPLVTSVKASRIEGRFDASYHGALVREVEELLRDEPTAKLGDARLTKAIRAVTKFRKRIYARESGMPLLTSRQVFQVDPIDLKGLVRGAHERDLAEIQFRENNILVTCSGTTGRIMIVPRYMADWAGSQDMLRIEAKDAVTAGYLYAWLASPYGERLVRRFTYGSVVVHVDREMMALVDVPLLDEKKRETIGNLVLEANRLRDQAWGLETTAIGRAASLGAG